MLLTVIHGHQPLLTQELTQIKQRMQAKLPLQPLQTALWTRSLRNKSVGKAAQLCVRSFGSLSGVEILKNQLQNPSLVQTQGFINGQWINAHSGQEFAVVDPATQEQVGLVASMGRQETLEAIDAAKHAQHQWQALPPSKRSALLKRWDAAIKQNADDLAWIASVESGKPLTEAKGEVLYATSFIEFFAHECMRTSGFVVPASAQGQQLMVIKQAVGVCGIIAPWNFPLAMITRKLGPCFAAGCTAVVKPAAETPFSALALAKLAEEVGLPPGVVNVVPAPALAAGEVGEAMTTSHDVRKISFTGSTRVGKILMQQSASNVKRLSLELGGNAPFIVFDDADLSAALDGLMFSKFRNTGQTCVCSNRIFLHSKIYDTVAKGLVERVKQLKVGMPREEGVQVGPLINQAGLDKVSSLVQDALAEGAKVLVGGRPHPQLGGLFYEPTVLAQLDESMSICHQEIFGPVVTLFRFDDEDEVIARANGVDAGLASYCYTKDLGRAWRVAQALEYGMVGVNSGFISNVQSPFGGIKQSGLGREGSVLGIEEYLESKSICMGGI